MNEFRPLKDAEATFDFSVSWDALEAMELEASDLARTFTMVQVPHYSLWYRFVIAVLRAAYGWLGYQGPPREIRTEFPPMRITSMREDGLGIHIEASTASRGQIRGQTDSEPNERSTQ